MARKTVTTLLDDLDGSPGEETVRFGLDGDAYEIDLSGDNAATLREVLAPWVSAGRRISRSGSRTTAPAQKLAAPTWPGTETVRPHLARDVRAWAIATGHTVPPRGRIPQSLINEYAAAH